MFSLLLQFVLRSPQDGHCILHSVTAITSEKKADLMNKIRREVQNNYETYGIFLGMSVEEALAELDIYFNTKNFNFPIIDNIFSIIGNIDNTPVHVHDPNHSGRIYSHPDGSSLNIGMHFLRTHQHYDALFIEIGVESDIETDNLHQLEPLIDATQDTMPDVLEGPNKTGGEVICLSDSDCEVLGNQTSNSSDCEIIDISPSFENGPSVSFCKPVSLAKSESAVANLKIDPSSHLTKPLHNTVDQ